MFRCKILAHEPFVELCQILFTVNSLGFDLLDDGLEGSDFIEVLMQTVKDAFLDGLAPGFFSCWLVVNL